MNKLIGLLLLTLAASAQAYTPDELDVICVQKAEIAIKIARLRNDHVEIQEAIHLLDDDENPQFVDDLPLIYTDEKMSVMSTAEIANHFYATCMKGNYSTFIGMK